MKQFINKLKENKEMRNKTIIIIILSIMVLITIFSCEKEPLDPIVPDPIIPELTYKEILMAHTWYSIDTLPDTPYDTTYHIFSDYIWTRNSTSPYCHPVEYTHYNWVNDTIIHVYGDDMKVYMTDTSCIFSGQCILYSKSIIYLYK